MRIRAAGALLGLLVAVAAVVSGCGATLDPVAQAATKTSSVSTMRMTFRMEMPTGSGGSVVLRGEGAYEVADQRMEMTMDYGPLLSALGQSGGGEMRMVMDHLVIYMDFPLLRGKLPSGKQWFSIDLQKAGRALGIDFASLVQQANQTDPRQALAALKQISSVVAVGTDEIRGVETTHYAGSVDIRKALDRLPEKARSGMEALIDQLVAANGGKTTYPIDVWVDAEGYVRRYRQETPTGQGSSTATVQTDMFDFGAPVDIQLPDPAAVFDATSVVSS